MDRRYDRRSDLPLLPSDDRLRPRPLRQRAGRFWNIGVHPEDHEGREIVHTGLPCSESDPFSAPRPLRCRSHRCAVPNVHYHIHRRPDYDQLQHGRLLRRCPVDNYPLHVPGRNQLLPALQSDLPAREAHIQEEFGVQDDGCLVPRPFSHHIRSEDCISGEERRFYRGRRCLRELQERPIHDGIPGDNHRILHRRLHGLALPMPHPPDGHSIRRSIIQLHQRRNKIRKAQNHIRIHQERIPRNDARQRRLFRQDRREERR